MNHRVVYCLIFLFFGTYISDAQENIKLTLQEAIQRALSNNPTILLSTSILKNQKYSIDTAESEFDFKIRPSAKTSFKNDMNAVGAGIKLEKRFESGVLSSISQALEKQDNDYKNEVGAALHIPLFRNFGKEKNLDSVKRAQFSYRTAERNLYIIQVNTVIDTVSGVYDILRAKHVVQVYESLIQRLHQHAILADMKEKIGLASPIDIYRAKITEKDAENNLALSREYLQNVEDRLKLILSIPLQNPIEVDAPLQIEPISIQMEDAIEIALKNRVELEQYTDEIKESQRRSLIAKQNTYPELELILEYNRFSQQDSFGDSFQFNEDRYSIGLAGNTDLTRTYDQINYQKSLIDIDMANLNRSLRENEIIREVRKQIESIRKTENRIKIREKQIEQAKGKIALSKIKFTYGMADNFDVIEAETELQKATVDLLSVKTDYIVGAYRLRAVMGTLIER